MKKTVLLLLTILSINCYAQITFEKGYYIDNTDKKIECLIKNEDWISSPTDFKFKLSDDNTNKIGIESVKEFGIYNVSKYIRKTVQIDLSSENIDNLSTDKNPEYKTQQLFLKVLVEGKANLYEALGVKKYFYNLENTAVEQLIFKSYKIIDNKIETNNLFRKQLWENLKCSNILMDELLKLEYKKNKLIAIFTKYNACSNSGNIIYGGGKTAKKDLFNLSLKARLNNSSLSINNDISTLRNTDFEKKTGVGFGIEAEFILPFNKNKWSIVFEPTYQSYDVKDTKAYSPLTGGELKTEVNYSSVEIPLGIRHYFYLNNNSKLFINAAFVFDAKLNATIKFTKPDNSTLNTLDLDNANNFAFGFGYKLHNKYSVEMRYHTSRNNLANYGYWAADYKTVSLLLGYTLF
jgi:hypothetical protein